MGQAESFQTYTSGLPAKNPPKTYEVTKWYVGLLSTSRCMSPVLIRLSATSVKSHESWNTTKASQS